MKEKRIALILMMFAIIFTFFGSTLAYLNWQTSEEQRTNVVFTLEQDFWCAADGGGDIKSTDASLAPAICTNSTHAIQRTVTVTPTIERNNLSINMDLWLDIDKLDSGLSNSKNFKYALTTNPNSCTEGVISTGDFYGLKAGNQVRILNKNYSNSTPQTYYLYVWLDAEETSASTMDQSFSLSMSGNCVDVPEPEAPVLDEGMIPVTLSSNGTVTTIAPGDEDWYDYDNKEWANVVLVSDTSRSTYQDKYGVTVNQSDILAYYTWIPRYSYRIPPVMCSSISGVNEIDNPECYGLPYTISDNDKELFINWWHYYEGDFLGNNFGVTYTFEEATEDVETMLNTGEVYVEEEDYTNYFTDVVRWYNNGNDPDISYTLEFLPNNIYSDSVEKEIDIAFESAGDSMKMGDTVNTYRTHPAFWWDNDSDGVVDSGETVAGIWVGKFETTGTASRPTILPNTSSLRSQNVSTQFATSKKFGASGNVYGLSNTNAHMMKNSEWGAVAYLSHSAYGINDEIRINNNDNYTTGCGALYQNDFSTSSCEISYNSSSTPQSTTGNITGVFDMSGGAYEYVMGVLADDNGNPRSGNSSSYNSGFNGLLGDGSSYTSGTSFPASKYYDLYNGTSSENSCNGGICYGHALSETANWYGDYDDFVDSGNPWFSRGADYDGGAIAGAFYLNSYDGHALSSISWRSVLVVGYGA